MENKRIQLEDLDAGWDLPSGLSSDSGIHKHEEHQRTLKEITGYHHRVMESLPPPEKDTITGVNAMLHPLGEIIITRLRKLKNELNEAPAHVPRKNIVAFHKDRLFSEMQSLEDKLKAQLPNAEFPKKIYQDCRNYISFSPLQTSSDFQNLIEDVLKRLYPNISKSSNFFESL